MAKRKGKAKSRKKKSQGPSWVSVIRRTFVLAALLVICFIGVLYVYNYLYPASEKKTVVVEQKNLQFIRTWFLGIRMIDLNQFTAGI